MTDEVLAMTVVPFEFPTADLALKALKDLERWMDRGQRDGSWYRLQGEDGQGTIVVAVVLTESGHAEPIVRRLRRGGGTFHDIPESEKLALVERTAQAGSEGLSGSRSYKIGLPLGMDNDPDLN